MEYVFKDGIGTGTYSTDQFESKGTIKNIDCYKDVLFGKQEYKFKNGICAEEDWEGDILKSTIQRHPV